MLLFSLSFVSYIVFYHVVLPVSSQKIFDIDGDHALQGNLMRKARLDTPSFLKTRRRSSSLNRLARRQFHAGNLLPRRKVPFTPPEPRRASKPGYSCSGNFYGIEYLETSKSVAKIRKPGPKPAVPDPRKKVETTYPVESRKNPCSKRRPCLLYPVFPKGLLYDGRSPVGKEMMKMDLNFKILGVFTRVGNSYRPCKTILRGINGVSPGAGTPQFQGKVPSRQTTPVFISKPGVETFVPPEKFPVVPQGKLPVTT